MNSMKLLRFTLSGPLFYLQKEGHFYKIIHDYDRRRQVSYKRRFKLNQFYGKFEWNTYKNVWNDIHTWQMESHLWIRRNDSDPVEHTWEEKIMMYEYDIIHELKHNQKTISIFDTPEDLRKTILNDPPSVI